MRRPKRFHRTHQQSWSSTDTMGSIPQSPKPLSLRGRDTGFPEPFCGHRNTTLPHPEANLSPDACLTEDDIAFNRAAARHRMSILANREQRSRATSTTSPEQHLYCASPVLMDDDDNGNDGKGKISTIGRLALTSLRGAELTGQLGTSRSSGDGGDSLLTSSSTGSSAGNSPTHLPNASGSKGAGETKRRLSFIHRFTRG